ncbi:hypothetical protein ACKWN4_30470, partial [Escherichia coli]
MSIKNDGHYFCRAGGNRPDGLNEPVTLVMPLTSDIGSRSFNLGLEVFRARIAANGRGDITVGGETVSIVYDATNGRFSSS